MAERYILSDGRVVRRGPRLEEAIAAFYTPDVFAERMDEDWASVYINGKEYGRATVLRAVDPVSFNELYRKEIAFYAGGEMDDVLLDIFGIEPIGNGPNFSANRKPGQSNNRKPRTPAKKSGRSAPRRH